MLFRGDRVAAAIMLAPTVVGFLLFLAGPMLTGLGLTLFRWDGLSPATFAGLGNYRALLADPLVTTTLWNTVSYVVPDVALKLALGLVLAVLIDRVAIAPLRTLCRLTIFFPVIISAVAGAAIWTWLLNTDLGLVDDYLQRWAGLRVAWLDSGDMALRSLVLVDVWRSLGFYVVVFTAGLQGIGRQYYEAAAIDGASGPRQFTHITLPLLSPTTFFLLIVGAINGFEFFDLSYVMTQGGPGDSTRTLVYYIYDSSFHFFRLGYGATLALLLFAIIGAITAVQFRLGRRWVFYG